MKGGFFDRHPALLVCYFSIVLILTISSLHPAFLVTSLLAAMGYRLLSGGLRQLKILLWMTPLFAFILLLNPLFVHEGDTLLFSLFGVSVTWEAVLYGACNAILLATVTLWIVTCVQVITAQKLQYLMGNRLPSLCLLLRTLLRFLPLFRQKAEEIKIAQYGIGRMQSKGGVFQRGKETASLLTVLTPWALEQSIHTANVLLARGYGASRCNHYYRYSFTTSDAVLLVLVLFFGGIAATGLWIAGQAQFYPTVFIPFDRGVKIALAAQVVLLLLPFVEKLWEEMRWIYYR